MSLHEAAQHLAAHGRGEDKVLIHMTKDEVKSLNDLAMAHGGSLTINPQTGLPEAGFLSAILPMALGAGLMMVPGMQAYAAAGIVGGLKTMQSGSLKQGLMAGLSAYGGAGLAGSAGAAGAGSISASPTAMTSAANTGAANAATMGSDYAQAFGANTAPSALTSTAAGTTGTAGGIGSMNSAALAPTGTNAATAIPSGGIGAQPVPSSIAGTTTPASTYSAAVPKDFSAMTGAERASAIKSGASFGNAADWASQNKLAAAGAAGSVAAGMQPERPKPAEPDKDMGQRYSYTGQAAQPTPAPDVPTYEDMLTKQGNFGRQQNYYPNPRTYTAISPSEAKDLYHFAGGGPVENMSNNAAIGANTMYPMANMATSAFATPYQTPQSTNMMQNMAPSGGGTVDAMSGEPNMQGTRLADGGIASFGFGGFLGDAVSNIGSAIGHIGKSDNGGSSEGWKKLLENMGGKQPVAEPAGYQYNAETQQYEPKKMAGEGGGGFSLPSDFHVMQGDSGGVKDLATGGLSDAHYNLGGYSDGGRLLRGPGDGVSDSIPATIGNKQPARLADGEFVVPARIVSELGNGSTEAGARKLYAMMDRVQAARKQTVGKDKVAHNSKADKHLPA